MGQILHLTLSREAQVRTPVPGLALTCSVVSSHFSARLQGPRLEDGRREWWEVPRACPAFTFSTIAGTVGALLLDTKGMSAWSP